MRTDVLPLCDEHFRTMEHCLAPFNADCSIEFFRCTAQFCARCFSERLGYVTPKRGEVPIVGANQPRCDDHNRPMFISSLDRQRNAMRFACPEANCRRTGSREMVEAGLANRDIQ